MHTWHSHGTIKVALLDSEKARRWAVWRVSPALCRPNGSRCSGRAAAACVDISSLFVAAGSWVPWGYHDYHEATIFHAATPGVTHDAHTETATYPRIECWVCSVQHEITRVLCDVCNCNVHFYNFQFPRSVLSRGGISCHNYALFSETRGDGRNSHQFIFVVSGVRPSLCSGYLYCRHPLIRISCHYCCCYIKFDMCVKSEPGQMTKMS